MKFPLFKKCGRLLTRSVRLPIISGPNRHLMWSLSTRTSFLRGSYESSLTRFTQSVVNAGDTFWDIGAHFGYYTLLGSRAVGDAGHVYCFEPSTSNLWYLNHHIAWNQLQNVSVQPFAIGGCVGERLFGGDCGTGGGELDRGNQQVHVETIDSLVISARCRPPTFIKMDVQGAETEVLRGGVQTLQSNPMVLQVATHGDQIHGNCLSILKGYGFRVWDYPQRRIIIAATPTCSLQAVNL